MGVLLFIRTNSSTNLTMASSLVLGWQARLVYKMSKYWNYLISKDLKNTEMHFTDILRILPVDSFEMKLGQFGFWGMRISLSHILIFLRRQEINEKNFIIFQYYGHEVYAAPAAPAPSNGPTSSSASTASSIAQSGLTSQESMMSNSDYITYPERSKPTVSDREQPQPQRPVIKMPKAVASVTSVPTRADYQQQLEANLERKRKRLGDLGLESGGDKKKGKKGRNAKNSEEDTEYKPKIGSSEIQNRDGSGKSSAESEKQRKTRGKPPKKCLADEPDDEIDDDLKAQSMRFAEEIRAQFDEPHSQKSSKGRKKKRKGGPVNEPELNNSKTPRLVIKFSKSPSSNVARSGTTENGGRDEYDFDDNAGPGPPSRGPSPGGASARDKLSSFGAMLTSSVDGTVDSSSVNNSPLTNEQIVTNQPTVKVAKLKIKI